ncbi:MAG: Uma2 family endonuclease [Verrucomicrobia bacterium]|nr:Uma2 family endonuclease [Verrucomicrobiota bacterium]
MAATQSSYVKAETGPGPAELLTYEQFLAWVDENTHVEWVSGKVVPMSPISREHSDLFKFLLKILLAFVEERGLGEIHCDPFQMKTGPALPGRSPDIPFVATENLDRLKTKFLDGPADLAIEIVSPESRTRDRGEKFYEYEEGGVKEYWLIDPQRQKAEFYHFGPDGPMEVSREGLFESLVLSGFWLKVDWMWQRPWPTLRQVTKEWGL